MQRYISLHTQENSESPLPLPQKELSINVVRDYIESSSKEILAKLPPPLPHRRNKHLYLLASVILFLTVLHNSTKIPHTTEHYKQADKESNGFFKDIPAHVWQAKKNRVKNQPKHNDKELGLRSKYTNRNSPSKWYEHNWQANFHCAAERRVGGTSEGAKYVCDVHRIIPSKECLVYSFGRGSPNSRTFDFAFEQDLFNELGGPGSCEIHVFDQRIGDYGGDVPEGITVHNWGLEGEIDAPKARRGFMTLKETVHHLGHEGRHLEIMRIDCDGCEWHTFSEWVSSGVLPRQLLVSLHGAPRNEDELFELMEKEDFAIFHREADTRYGGLWQEYGFLKLDPSFFKK
jgi:hypothetical protein